MIGVLLVDDQELVREGLRVILDAQQDITVVGEASDGDEVVEAVRTLGPDVVLLDVRMPRCDGIEAVRRLRNAGLSSVAVLMLTTFDLDEYVYDALRAGANGFLLKDAPRSRLIDAVRVLAAGDALLDPSVTRRLLEAFVPPGTAPAVPAAVARLSPRELEVLLALATGHSNAEIAVELFVSEATVKTHVGSVLRKLSLRDRTHAVVYAYEAGLVVRGAAPESAVAPPCRMVRGRPDA